MEWHHLRDLMQYSDNGWPGIPERYDTKLVNVPGTDLHFRTAPAAAWVLGTFAARFHTEVESLSGGQLDDWSYAWRNVRGSSSRLSCHASATALDLNALMHPRGVRGTFGEAKLKRLRHLLREFADPDNRTSVIRWGGDFSYPSIVDEMHFQIRGDKAALRRVEHRLKRIAEEEDDVSFDDRHILTDADVAAYGQKGLVAGKSEKAFQEIVRFPPGVQRLRRELAVRDAALADQIRELTKAIAKLSLKKES